MTTATTVNIRTSIHSVNTDNIELSWLLPRSNIEVDILNTGVSRHRRCATKGTKTTDSNVGSRHGDRILQVQRDVLLVWIRRLRYRHILYVFQRVKVFAERGNDAFPLSELQAAVLLPQLRALEATNSQRRQAVEQLLKACTSVPALAPLQLSQSSADQPAFYKFPWRLQGNTDACDSPDFELRRQALITAIQAEGVAMDAGFRGFARRTSQRCRCVGTLPNARIAAGGTVILHHPVLLEPPATITRLAQAIKTVAGRILDHPSGS